MHTRTHTHQMHTHIQIHTHVHRWVRVCTHTCDETFYLISHFLLQWTLMSYMIEGGGSPTLSRAKSWLYRYPEASHTLLQAITDVNVDYLEGQVLGGAQMLQVFESHAGLLGAHQFSEFCLPYLTQIAEKLKERLKKHNVPDIPMVRCGCSTEIMSCYNKYNLNYSLDTLFLPPPPPPPPPLVLCTNLDLWDSLSHLQLSKTENGSCLQKVENYTLE